jgi:Flp pilus assembly CpaE family ATPase
MVIVKKASTGTTKIIAFISQKGGVGKSTLSQKPYPWKLKNKNTTNDI